MGNEVIRTPARERAHLIGEQHRIPERCASRRTHPSVITIQISAPIRKSAALVLTR
jgi:hypothetical protein